MENISSRTPELNKPTINIKPPLHIKLQLIKQSVKGIDKNETCFLFLSKLSAEKINTGNFDGPQIRSLIKDSNLTTLTQVDKNAWNEFLSLLNDFMENKKHSVFPQHVKLLMSYHLDYIPQTTK